MTNRTFRVYQLTTKQDVPFSYDLIDLSAGGRTSALRLNVEEHVFYSSSLSPVRQEDQRQKLVSPEDAKQLDVIEEAAESEEVVGSIQYRAAVAFDPRIRLGTWIQVEDPELFSPLINVDSVTHQFGGTSYQTSFSGTFEHANTGVVGTTISLQ